MKDRTAGSGTFLAPTTFSIQRLLPGPIERVWNYLTDGELRRKWLAAGDMPQVNGSAFELVWRNDTLSRAGDTRPEGFGEEHRMSSTVISIEPPRRLVIAWGDGEVSFELETRGDDVLLTLVHSGLATGSLSQVAAGWHVHLDILAARLTDQEPVSFWSTWTARRAAYQAQLS
jgi:uncharacterized protein YndB with AHSA1/START domain